MTRIILYLDEFLFLLNKYESNIGVVSGLQLPKTAVFSKGDRCNRRVQRDLRVRPLAHLSRAVSRYRCRSFYVCRNRRISCFASWASRVQHRDRRSRDLCLVAAVIVVADAALLLVPFETPQTRLYRCLSPRIPRPQTRCSPRSNSSWTCSLHSSPLDKLKQPPSRGIS